MPKHIHVENAEVKTFTADLLIIRINKRQMTLSTFRQLPLVPIIDTENMVLRGKPWGHVNYWWKGACGQKGYVQFSRRTEPIEDYLQQHAQHVVWENEGALCRDIVCPVPDYTLNDLFYYEPQNGGGIQVLDLIPIKTLREFSQRGNWRNCSKEELKTEAKKVAAAEFGKYSELVDELFKSEQLFIAS